MGRVGRAWRWAETDSVLMMDPSPDGGHGTRQEWEEAGWEHWRGTGGTEKGVV